MIPVLVTPEEHDRGWKDLPLTYHRGPAPDGYPVEIRLTAPSRHRAGGLALIIQKRLQEQHEDPFGPVLLACLPTDYNRPEFVDRLSFECIGHLTATAMVMTFGAGTQKKMEALAELAAQWMGATPSAPSSPSSAPGLQPAAS